MVQPCFFDRYHLIIHLMINVLALTPLTTLAANNITNTPAAQTPTAQSPATQMVGAEIASTLRDNSDMIWLTPAQGDTFLLLSKADETGENKGTLLLLPDNHQHANWPGLLRHLRTQLPTQGWTTLAITLPPLNIETQKSESQKTSEPSLSKKDAAKTANQPETASSVAVNTDAGLADFIKQSQLRFERSLLFIQEQKLPGKLIIVAIGTSASAWFGAMQQGYQPTQLDGIILIDAYQPFPDPNLDISNETIKLAAKIPVTDIFQTEHPHIQQMQQRQQRAQQQHAKHYSAKPLPPTFRQLDLRFSEPELILIEKRIHTWLESEFIQEKPKS